MATPWIVSGTSQSRTGNAGLNDLYKSDNVFVNGVNVVLYDVPGESPAQAAATLANISLDDVFHSQGPEAADKAQQALVTAGIITQAEYDNAKTAAVDKNNIDSAGSAFTGTSAVIGLANFANIQAPVPDTLQLTPNGTTMATMIRKVTFPKHNVQAQKGLTVPQIVTNLANLAQNIYEPLKAKYPDVFITNTFREGENQSQHGTGQAMDVQFHRVPASEYLTRAQWMRDNLPFDQLLLECHTSGALWIHVSHYCGYGIKVQPINKVAYMINDANFTPGLKDLSTVSGVRQIPAA
jgi:hypothetical protein